MHQPNSDHLVLKDSTASMPIPLDFHARGVDGRMRFVDFDWCELHGTDRYIIIGNGIEWAVSGHCLGSRFAYAFSSGEVLLDSLFRSLVEVTS